MFESTGGGIEEGAVWFCSNKLVPIFVGIVGICARGGGGAATTVYDSSAVGLIIFVFAL